MSNKVTSYTGNELEIEKISSDKLFVIRGLAVPYDNWTKITNKDGSNFLECVMRGAMSSLLENDKEVLFQLHHEGSLVIGGTESNLRLIDKPDGLYFEATIDAETELGNVALSGVRSAAISGCSISFRAVKERWEDSWMGLPGIQSRILTKIELKEISLVSKPAYSSAKAEVI